MSKQSSAIKAQFSELTDSRQREVTSPLINVVTIAFVHGGLRGTDNFVAVAGWGVRREIGCMQCTLPEQPEITR